MDHRDFMITKLGLDEYLAQPIVKAQNRRAYELITTLTRVEDDIATAILIDLAGEEIEVMITLAMIATVTKLPKGDEPVTRQGLSDNELGDVLVPFKGLKESRIEMLLRVLHQHLHFERQTRYTRPHRNLTSPYINNACSG